MEEWTEYKPVIDQFDIWQTWTRTGFYKASLCLSNKISFVLIWEWVTLQYSYYYYSVIFGKHQTMAFFRLNVNDWGTKIICHCFMSMALIKKIRKRCRCLITVVMVTTRPEDTNTHWLLTWAPLGHRWLVGCVAWSPGCSRLRRPLWPQSSVGVWAVASAAPSAD